MITNHYDEEEAPLDEEYFEELQGYDEEDDELENLDRINDQLLN
jgi:hypothetical protein